MHTLQEEANAQEPLLPWQKTHSTHTVASNSGSDCNVHAMPQVDTLEYTSVEFPTNFYIG